MKLKLLSLFAVLSAFSVPASALQFSVGKLCESSAAFQAELPAGAGETLGQITVQALKENQIPFQGDASGIKSISNSPVGDEALEILSDTEMRAYGWCVLVDGQQPDRMPDEIQVTVATKSIQWFYAFALYDSGQWKSFCTPAYLVQPSQICAQKP